MAQLSQVQLNSLLQTQFALYQQQQEFGVGPDLQPAMDAVQKKTRALAGSDPGPTPDPSDPLATFRARQAVSQNCAWFLMTPQEAPALLTALGDAYHVYVNFYTPGGSGALGVNERLDAGLGYVFVNANQDWQQDVNQAADVRVAQIAASQPTPVTVPPPAVV